MWQIKQSTEIDKFLNDRYLHGKSVHVDMQPNCYN